MIVAIDGPAGSGKSTVAKALADREGLTYLDTGAMYRAVTLACLEQGVDVNDPEAVAKVAQGVTVAFEPAAEKGAKPRVLLEGKDVTEEIRTAKVDQNVSAVSAVPAVREAMVALQREMGATGDVVAEGRDIGTVVFPNADVKVFLSADAAARARRRTIEREGANAADPHATVKDSRLYDKVYADIVERDRKDEAREASPLVKAKDAVEVDSTTMTPKAVVDTVARLVAQARAGEPLDASDPEADKDEKAPKPEKPSKPASEKADKPAASKKKAAKDEPMRAFHCEFDDYPEHSISDWPLPSRLFYDFMCGVVYGFTKLYWPFEFEGGEEFVEQLKNSDKGTVLVQNHVSMVEPVITVVWMWRNGLRVRPVYKREFEKNDFFRWIFSRVGGIPVNRGTADLKCMRRCQRAIQRGESVLIYPEGTRVRTDGADAEVHGGFALIAQLAKSDVTPSAVIGVRDITPNDKLPARPHRVWFKIGRPVKFGELGVKGRKQKLDAMEKRAMARVWELRAQLRQEHPGEW